MRRWCLILPVVIAACEKAPPPDPRPHFLEAIDLIHTARGYGQEYEEANHIADVLAWSHPDGGYTYALRAEYWSVFSVTQDGKPEKSVAEVLELADRALADNPRLALPHVSRARVWTRQGNYAAAERELAAAEAIDPDFVGTIFMHAEIHRRRGELADAERWYRRFIDARVHPVRRANAWSWMGQMYQDAADKDVANRAAHVAKAREAYTQWLQAVPPGPREHAWVAAFYNGAAGDFAAAEAQALAALEQDENSLAWLNLAAARYQQIEADAAGMPPQALAQAVAKVADECSLTLDAAIADPLLADLVHERLKRLRARLPA